MWEQFTTAINDALFEEFVPTLALGLVRGFFVFVIALSVVYLFGRMLGFLKTYRQKNFVGFLVMVPMAYWLTQLFGVAFHILFDYLLYISFAILWYVLVGFRLYDRADHFLDKKIADDK
jgi:hypothetical protein